MPIVKTSSKGQVVIPAEVRAEVGLEIGQEVRIEASDGKIIVTPLSKDPIHDLFGILKEKPSLTKELVRERRKEMKREERKASRFLRGSGLSSSRTRRQKSSSSTRKS